MKEYIYSEFASNKEKANRLLKQLEWNPAVESVCSIPLNCAIVCHLWDTLEGDLPTSMTELYSKIVLNVAFRNIQKCHEDKRILSVQNFDSFPMDLQESWWLLCELAFRSIGEGQIVYSQEDLMEVFPEGLSLDDKIFSFGLLQSAEFDFEVGHEVSFHFLHLTFQEYLAALYIARQPYCKQLEMFIAYKTALKQPRDKVIDKNKLFMVWRFFFGLCFNAHNIMVKDNMPLLQDVKEIIETFDPFTEQLVLCHCAYEANNEVVNHEIVGFLNNESHSFCKSLGCTSPENAYDCAAVVHIINNTSECANIKIAFFNSGTRDSQIKTLTDALARKRGKLQIVSLNLSFNQLTDTCIADLFCRASCAFQSLDSLQLIGNTIGAYVIQCITTALEKSTLQGLNLSLNPLAVPGILELENAVNTDKLTNLRHLGLMRCLTSDADINGALLTTLLEALLTHCPYLRSFDVSDNNLGVPGAVALGNITSQFTNNLTEYCCLSMNETKLGDEGLNAFIDSLQGSLYIDLLELRDNDIHGTGASYLAKNICSGRIVMKGYMSRFDLDGNPLGLRGTLEIAGLLKISYCDCQYLDRCKLATNVDCQLMTHSNTTTPSRTLTAKDVGQQLYTTPRTFSCQISLLHLSGNCFTGDGIQILVGLIRLCPRLQFLDCDHCRITSGDLSQLLVSLTDIKSFVPLFYILKQWNLSNNEIDDRGIETLGNHLPVLFPSLRVNNQHLRLDNNRISNDKLAWLEKELHRQGCAKVSNYCVTLWPLDQYPTYYTIVIVS